MKKSPGLNALIDLLHSKRRVLEAEELTPPVKTFLKNEVCPKLKVSVDSIELVAKLTHHSSFYRFDLLQKYPQQIKLSGDRPDGTAFEILIAYGDTSWMTDFAVARQRGTTEEAPRTQTNYRYAAKGHLPKNTSRW